MTTAPPSARPPLGKTLLPPIVFDGRKTPVKATLFFVICFAWILPGLIGHDPWKSEALTLSVIHTLLQQGQWLLPHVSGLPGPEYPPLYYWVAALTARLFSPWLALHDGARLASGLFMGITLYYAHRTAQRLLDERAGRIAVLLLIGSLGALQKGHELNPEIAGMAGFAIALYGMTRIRSEPRKGGITCGIGAGIMAATIGMVPALTVPLIHLALITCLNDWRNRDFKRGMALSLLISVGVCAGLLVLYVSSGADRSAIYTLLGSPLFDSKTVSQIAPGYFLQLLPWYALPALPFALWLWHRDRRKLRERIELALPLVAFTMLLLMVAFTRVARDASALALLIPLALAGAHALDRLPRGLASFMDWFGLIFFGLLALTIWGYWSAAMIGLPRGLAKSVANNFPGYTPHFSWLIFAICLTLTLVWLYAVIRAHRNNRRAIVNWTAGITLVWLLVNLLGSDAANHVRSYRSVARQIAARIPADACVAAINLGDPERALLHYFNDLRFRSPAEAGALACRWLLVEGSRDLAQSPLVPAEWQMVWQGNRAGDEVERFRLYRR